MPLELTTPRPNSLKASREPQVTRLAQKNKMKDELVYTWYEKVDAHFVRQ